MSLINLLACHFKWQAFSIFVILININKMKNIPSLILIIIITSITGFTQYQITNYTTFNTGSCSLGVNTILSIAENPVTNEMYFSSTDGLMKFDGTGFSPVLSALDYPVIFEIFSHVKFDIDPSGNIWFGAWDSLYCYTGTSLQSYPYFIPIVSGHILCSNNGMIWFTRYNYDGIFMFDGVLTIQYTTNDGLLQSSINCTFEDSNGNIWLGFNNGICKFDGINWTSYSAQSGLVWNNTNNTSTVSAICEDEAGTIWVSGYEIAYLTGNTWTTLNPTTLLNSSQEIIANTSITLDNNGVLWFKSGEGLFYKDGNTWGSYFVADGLPTNIVRDLYTDSQNRMWVGFESKGLSVLENGTWTNYNTLDNGLADNYIYDIFEDTTNTVWFCTRHGLSNIQNNTWTSYFTDFQRGVISEIHYDYNNNLFISEQNYFHKYVNNIWEPVLIASNNGLEFISYSIDDYWFAGNLGVTHVWAPFSAVTNFVNYSVADGLPNTICYCIERDSSETIWVGTRNGIAYFDGTGFQQLIVPSDDFGNRIYDIRIDLEENIWFASNSGVAKYDGTNWNFYFETEGLINNWVYDIEIGADSSIWFATKRGVSALIDSTMISITEADGLSDCMVLTLEQDHEGNIWAGTYHGISKIHNAINIPPNNIPTVNNDFSTISIYPNPASTSITIASNEAINKIEIYNQTGQLVKIIHELSLLETSNNIDISDLRVGSYFVRVFSKDNSWAEKFLIIR